MSLVTTFFDPGFKGKTYKLSGRYFEHFTKAFPGYKKMLEKQKECIAFFAGRENENAHAYSIKIEKTDIFDDRVLFELGDSKKLDITSRYVSKQLKKISDIYKTSDERGLPPVVYILPEKEDIAAAAQRQIKIEELMSRKEYNAVCMMFAPLSEADQNPYIWNDADILYDLGMSCSKMAVSLLTPAKDVKELEKKAKYRKYSIAFFKRGYEIEPKSARFATALAYRYYSNVHELMRPGERRDENLEHEMENANEWLSRAIEMNPDSIKNHYRKGKLIIEKQVPYLLFAKKSYGKGEASLLREIRQVGEEHLVQALMLYENLNDEKKKQENLREYAKALFVLGKYYLDDTNLPIYEYYLTKLMGQKPYVKINKIDKLNLESARVHLKRSFAAECDMHLDGMLNIKKLAEQEKKWTNSPIKKLYHIGAMYCDTAFVLMVEGDKEKSERYAQKAIKILDSAKKVSDTLRDRKRNTWYISEKIAWAYMHTGRLEMAAKLLMRAKAGYAINTFAIASLLADSKNTSSVRERLDIAVNDKHNLAEGLSNVLYEYVRKAEGKEAKLNGKELSSKNKKYAGILGLKTP